MRPTTLQRLQVFRAVYEEGSISAAARRLKLAQPTVSRHLRDFEVALGFILFSLSKGRVFPTTEADILFADSGFLSEGLNRLENRISMLQKGADSRLVLSTIGFLLPEVVSPAISHVLRQYPELNISVDAATAAQQIEALRQERIDLGIVGGQVNVSGIYGYSIGKGKLVALVPEEDPLNREASLSLKSIHKSRSFVRIATKSPIGNILNRALENLDLSYTGHVTCYSLLAVAQIARSMKLIAIIDEFTGRYVKLEGMTVVPLEELVEFEIQAISATEIGASKSVKGQLVAALKKNLRGS